MHKLIERKVRWVRVGGGERGVGGVQKALIHCVVLLSFTMIISFVQAFEESNALSKNESASGADAGTCTVCGAGKHWYKSAAGFASCVDICNADWSGAEGICMVCARGKYKSAAGADTCTSCPANSTSPHGSTMTTVCRFYSGWRGSDGGTCTACDPGKHKSVAGDGICEECPAHSDSPLASIAITLCACNAGYTGGTAGPRTACVAGKYKCVSGADNCSSCPSDSESPKHSTALSNCTCNPGWQGPDGGACMACVARKFKIAAGDGNCSSCPADSSSPVQRTALTDCLCNAGYSGNAGGPCTACVGEKWNSAAGAASCDACPTNSSSPSASVAITSCTCNADWWGAHGGTCTACGAGKYMSAGGSGSCECCPAASTSPHASILITHCTCNSRWRGAAGGTCTACDLGKYKSAAVTGDRQECPAHSDSPGASSATTDCACKAGYSGTDGGPCTACVTDKYKDATGFGGCDNCPSHVNSALGSIMIANCTCNAGSTGQDGGPCAHCTLGTYKAVNGSVMCTDCRYCKHLRAIGATAYLCLAEGGDGHVANVQEDRDDNNTESGDGCDSSCLVECGYNCCAHDPSTCSAISTPCQYKDGSLVSQDLAPQAVVSLSSDNLSNMYPTAEASYMFTARVSKTLKAAQVFQMPVTLTEQMIVQVSALEAASGEIQPTGDVRINSEDEFVVHGRCQHNAPAQIGWTFTPSITLEFYEALADDVVGSVACAAILFGAAAYLTKMNYKTSSEYLAAKAKMMEGAQEKTEEREVAAGEVARKSNDNNHSGYVSEEVAGVQGVHTDTPAKTGMIST